MLNSKIFPVVIVSVFAALGLTACEGEVSVGKKTISAEKVEQQSAEALEQKYAIKPKSVDCEDSLEAEVGATNVCQLTDSAGDTYDMQVTVTETDGETAKWDIEVLGATESDSAG